MTPLRCVDLRRWVPLPHSALLRLLRGFGESGSVARRLLLRGGAFPLRLAKVDAGLPSASFTVPDVQ